MMDNNVVEFEGTTDQRRAALQAAMPDEALADAEVEKKFTDNEPDDITILDMSEEEQDGFFKKIIAIMEKKRIEFEGTPQVRRAFRRSEERREAAETESLNVEAEKVLKSD